MPIMYDIPAYKKKRIIVDTDAACEADDPFAIVHALLSKKFLVKALLAEHFVADGSTKRSFEEIQNILNLMNIEKPVYMGELTPISGIKKNELSDAALALIEEANRESEIPLFVLCLGALTNVANAIRNSPEIIKKMTVVWIGGHSWDVVNPDHKEFNSGNDVDAVNIVTSSGVEFWQIPNNVYGTMHIGIAEIQNRISRCGAIGKHLFENLIDYNNSSCADWTSGESWSLGDSPAVGVVLEPNCGTFIYREAPVLQKDTSYQFEQGRPMIRVYQSINSRFIIEDLISKLELTY